MSRIEYYAQLRKLITQMEADMGIADLSEIERNVISAMVLVSEGTDKPIHLSQLRDHALLASMPQPSLYRAFQNLIKAKLIKKAGTSRSGLYSPKFKRIS